MKEITIAEAAERLGLDVTRVRRLVASGRIIGRKVGPMWLLVESSVRAWKPRPQGSPGHIPKKKP